MCKLILMISASGGGKSTKAKALSKEYNAIICSADHYFYDIFGNYNFDATKIGHAHQMCYDKAYRNLENGISVIIDNTNANTKDRKKYESLAEIFNLTVEYVEPDTNWRYNVDELMKTNTKGTPREVIQRQVDGVLNWKKNLGKQTG